MARERRKNVRLDWASPATIRRLDGRLVCRCVLADLSSEGAKITGVTAGVVPDRFMLRVDRGLNDVRECQVLWRSADALGVEFTGRAASTEPKKGVKVSLVRKRDHVIR